MGKDWDQHVAAAEELAGPDGFERLRDEIVRLARPGPDDVVVDVGRGTGLLTLALAPYVATAWAIDISEAMLDHLATTAAAADLDNVETALANASRVGPDRSELRSPCSWAITVDAENEGMEG